LTISGGSKVPTKSKKADEEVTILLPERPSADRLRRFREFAGLTQAELARQSGLTRVTINRWERGHRSPDDDELSRVLDILRRHIRDRATGIGEAAAKVGALNRKYGARDPEKSDALRFLVDTLKDRAQIASIVAIADIDAQLPPDAWATLFMGRASVFNGLPVSQVGKSEPYVLGYDVGVALDAAIRGMTYPERATSLGGVRNANYATVGAERLANEVGYALGEIQTEIATLPSNKAEWDAFEPNITVLDR
jgi:transcriptional regulator with XRE-family HTH domain